MNLMTSSRPSPHDNGSTMLLSRRNLLALSTALAGGLGPVQAQTNQSEEGWYPIRSDDGKPVQNIRVPVELTSEVEGLPGLVWVGPGNPDVTFFEFFDYNCPFCRKAVKDIHALLRSKPALRLGLVNNPILSPMSAQAAKVEFAFLGLKGPAVAYDFHRKLFAEPGPIDGFKALRVATALGVPKEQLEQAAYAPEVREALSRQMRLAASLGLGTTPSFLIGGAAVLGYPGPKALEGMISAYDKCGQIAC